MEFIAKANNVRMSPRKVRLVTGLIRGMTTDRALRQLQMLNKAAAPVVLKLLRSALANATHNFQHSGEGLSVVSLRVDGGPVLYRYRPRAQGRAAPVRKRTSHITLILGERKR